MRQILESLPARATSVPFVAANRRSSISQIPEVFPKDEHNATLVANVHPPDWRNPEPAPRYNLVVIGAGTAGLVTAAGAAGLGAKVALIERHLLGGDCLNVGCVPSKCVIRSSRVLGDLAAAAELGVHVPAGTEVDFPAVNVRLNTALKKVTSSDKDKRLLLDSGGNEEVLAVDEILMGVGRAPNVEGLNFETAGVEYSKQGVRAQAEAIRKAADAYNRTRLTPFVKKLFQRWLAWTR